MILKTRGIVFRAIKYSETSLITDIFTEEKGMLTFIISGVRKSKARFSPGLFQPGSLVEVVAYFREGKEIHRISEVRPDHLFQQLHFDVAKSSVVIFLSEIARKVIHSTEENRPLFGFLHDLLVFIDETPSGVANIPAWFLVHLTAYLGLMPGGSWDEEQTTFFDLEEGLFCRDQPPHAHYCAPGLARHLYDLQQKDVMEAVHLSIPGAERRKILEHLITYYQLQIEHLPAILSHKVLEEVLG